MDPGVTSQLELVILDPEWSGSSQTGAPGDPVLYPNRKSSIPNWNEVKGGRTEIY